MPRRSSPPLPVAMIVDDGSNPFEVGVVTELFGLHRPEFDRPLYDLVVCAARPEVRMHRGVFTMTGVAGLDALDGAHTVVVPNRPDPGVPPDPAVLAAVRRAAERGVRMVSLCTGAFTLAAAGVLDGRRATTHWQWAGLFGSLFPTVRLEPDVLFVDDGDVLTSAGSAAALDLGLHIVRRDHGAEAAASVARRLVFALHRDGGQRQFVERPVAEVSDTSLAQLLEWAQERIDGPLTVAELAAAAAVSPATLHRRFRAELGTTPLAWLTGERVALACRLMERGEVRLDVVARRSGLGTASNLREQVRRHTGLSPSDYRRRFGPVTHAAGAPGEVRPRCGLRGRGTGNDEHVSRSARGTPERRGAERRARDRCRSPGGSGRGEVRSARAAPSPARSSSWHPPPDDPSRRPV